MQIIIVDRRWARARTLNVSGWTLALGSVVAVGLVLAAVAVLYALTFRMATNLRVPVLHDVVSFIMRDEVDRANQFARDNVTAMARKLGEMQAKLMRLDALGERVSKVAGIRPEEFNFKELPGRGGALPTDARQISMNELQTEITRASKSIEQRADYMDVIESELLSNSVRNALLPQNTPVSEGFVGSGFGMRMDPFTGQYSMHSGVDFAAPVGTPIFAAAGGVVISAETHPAFGNMVEIDHGNQLSTLYAHASRIDVKVGDLVKRGQQIAVVGTTGRSTGPHLHFEVHVKGAPQNPSRFLASLKPSSPLATLVEHTHSHAPEAKTESKADVKTDQKKNSASKAAVSKAAAKPSTTLARNAGGGSSSSSSTSPNVSAVVAARAEAPADAAPATEAPAAAPAQ